MRIRCRMSGIPIGKGPVTTHRLPLTPEANRADGTRGDSFARQRGPVGDPKDDEKWGDALFIIIVEKEHPMWLKGAEKWYEPEPRGGFERQQVQQRPGR